MYLYDIMNKPNRGVDGIMEHSVTIYITCIYSVLVYNTYLCM